MTPDKIENTIANIIYKVKFFIPSTIFTALTFVNLVAGPEIIKASKVPSLAPASLKTDKSGTTVASEM